MHLVEILANLAEANEEESIVDNDSMLGSQYSTYDNEIKEDNEDDEVEDLNITSLDLGTLSSWNSISKDPSQSSTSEIENKNVENVKKMIDTAENNTEDTSLLNFPQYDGVNDLCLNGEVVRKCYITERNKQKKLRNKLNKKLQLMYNKNEVPNNFLQKGITFELNLHGTSNARRKLYQALCERYFIKITAFNINLFSNINNCIKNIHLHKNQIREFKSKRRRVVEVVKQNASRSRNMLNVCNLDHRDLDVYDVDEIELTLSAVDYTDLKQTIRFSKSHSTINDPLMELKVPALDGNTVDSSSDSEIDQDITINREEKRICVYKSCTKSNNDGKVINASFLKRKLQSQDTGFESPTKRRNVNSDSVQNESHYTPTKTRNVQSPKVRKYSPLNVKILSPKADRNIEGNGSSRRDPCSSTSDCTFVCTTPKRDNHRLRLNLLREKVSGLPSEKKQGEQYTFIKNRLKFCDIT